MDTKLAREILTSGFCPHCGARFPALYGQGLCEKCRPIFKVLDPEGYEYSWDISIQEPTWRNR